MDAEEGFESARYLVEYAKEQIADFNGAVRAFYDDKPYGAVIEFNSETGHKELKIKEFKPIPFALRGKASGIVKDLRDALDQVVGAATTLIAGKPNNLCHFPFGNDPADLENSLSLRKNGKCKGIAPELYEVLRRIEPYPTGDGHAGGNDILKGLSKVAGPNKHRVALSPAVQVRDLSITGAPGTNHQINSGTGGGAVIFPDSEWDTKKRQMVIVRVGPDGEINVHPKASVYIAFGNTALRGLPVPEFLQICHAFVKKAVEDIEAEARLIGPRPT